MALGEKRLTGAVVLIVIAMTIYGVKYVSYSLQKSGAVLSYTAPDPSSLMVELAGDTDRNGIFILKKRSTISDLLMSGGMGTDEYYADDVTAVLHHGDKITIDRRAGHHSKIRIGAMAASKRYVLDMAMDINSAAADDLDLVPGIGKRSAEDIIVMRERRGGFRSMDELQKIPVLRGMKYQELNKYFFIEKPT